MAKGYFRPGRKEGSPTKKQSQQLQQTNTNSQAKNQSKQNLLNTQSQLSGLYQKNKVHIQQSYEPPKVIKLSESQPIPDIKKIEFKAVEEIVLSGRFSIERTDKLDQLKICPQDCFGNFGIVSLWYQNACYTNGKYNHNDYRIERGLFFGKQAFKVYPPSRKADNFRASEHCISFLIKQKQDYNIYSYSLQDKTLNLTRFEKNKVNPNSWNIVPSLKISDITKPIIFTLCRQDQKLNLYSLFGNNIQGATIHKDQNIRVEILRFPLPDQSLTPQNFPWGPSSHGNLYNPNRDFFHIWGKGKEYLVWQNSEKNSAYLTELKRSTLSIFHKELKITQGFCLAAACGDDNNLVYCQVEKNRSQDMESTRKMQLIKCDYNGVQKQRVKLQTDKHHLNVYSFETCHMAINKEHLGFFVSRRMTRQTDGLNHQGAYAALYDLESLKPIKYFGQTSSHSFSNTLLPKKQGEGFIGMDLGDGYPRGINHWIFDEQGITYKSVFHMKTQHGKRQKNPAGVSFPPYKQISSKDIKFFKWSNDNKTYTELAAPGVIEHESGNIIIFAAENEGGSLNNAYVSEYNNSPRNIGFVKVSKDLQKIISKGIQQKGGCYTFVGAWQDLKNQGIKWLSNLPKDQNVSRIKAIDIKEKIFILFQIWNQKHYINTQYMIISMEGQILTKCTLVQQKMKMHRSDDIYFTGKSVVVYSGDKPKGLRRYQIIFQ